MIPTLAFIRHFTLNYVPIFILIFYLLDQARSIPSWLYFTPLIANIFFTVITVTAWITNVPLLTFFSFGWRYQIALAYPIYFFINWIIVHVRTRDLKLASMIATLSTISVGWLYEIPLYLVNDWTRPFFNPDSNFFIPGRMIAFIFLIYLLKKNGWKYTRNTETLLIGLVFFSLIWMFVLIPLPTRIIPLIAYRLPAMAFMTSLSAEINGASL